MSFRIGGVGSALGGVGALTVAALGLSSHVSGVIFPALAGSGMTVATVLMWVSSRRRGNDSPTTRARRVVVSMLGVLVFLAGVAAFLGSILYPFEPNLGSGFRVATITAATGVLLCTATFSFIATTMRGAGLVGAVGGPCAFLASATGIVDTAALFGHGGSLCTGLGIALVFCTFGAAVAGLATLAFGAEQVLQFVSRIKRFRLRNIDGYSSTVVSDETDTGRE
jgi:hypothetical protein